MFEKLLERESKKVLWCLTFVSEMESGEVARKPALKHHCFSPGSLNGIQALPGPQWPSHRFSSCVPHHHVHPTRKPLPHNHVPCGGGAGPGLRGGQRPEGSGWPRTPAPWLSQPHPPSTARPAHQQGQRGLLSQTRSRPASPVPLARPPCVGRGSGTGPIRNAEGQEQLL